MESVKIIKESAYYNILTKFPAITMSTCIKKAIKEHTVHHIKTMQGLPEARRSRRLALNKLQAAKTEFNLLLKGHNTTFKESPLPLTLKKGSTGRERHKYIYIYIYIYSI